MKALENLRCHTPSKQFGGPKSLEAVGSILSLHALGDYIFAIYSDLTLCSYKLYPSRGTLPFQFKNDKARGMLNKNASRLSSAVGNRINVNDVAGSTTRADTSSKHCSDFGNSSFAMTFGGNAKVSSSGVTSTDSSYLLMSCGYFDNCVKVQSLDSVQLRSNQNGGHKGPINCLQVGEDGTILVTGGQDATCRLWVLDHDLFASALIDGFVHSSLGIERDLMRCCHVLLGHVTPITCVAISTKLDVVVSGSEDGSICIHNIRSGKFVRSLHIDAISKEVSHSCAINGLSVKKIAIHVHGSFVAHLSDGSLHLITVNGQRLFSTHVEENLYSMIICAQSETLITGGEKGLARIWKLHDLSLQCTVDVEKYGAITSLALTSLDTSPAAQFLCVGSSNGYLSIVYRSAESK